MNYTGAGRPWPGRPWGQADLFPHLLFNASDFSLSAGLFPFIPRYVHPASPLIILCVLVILLLAGSAGSRRLPKGPKGLSSLVVPSKPRANGDWAGLARPGHAVPVESNANQRAARFVSAVLCFLYASRPHTLSTTRPAPPLQGGPARAGRAGQGRAPGTAMSQPGRRNVGHRQHKVGQVTQ